jgi:hypothetical protein
VLLIIKNIFRCQFLNSDDVIILRGNQNFHLHLFVKGGALNYGIRAVCSMAQ